MPQGSTLQDVARELRLPDEFVVARMNNEVFGLQTELSQDCTVEFLAPPMWRECGHTGLV